jgi:ATP-dependent DNA helicase RecQ
MEAYALQILKEHFGFSEFRTGQKEVIANLLSGKSAAAVFPTGSGKSLCYQLPALTFSGLTLVVSPLIALMKDQIDALAARDIAARRLDSTLSADEHRAVMADVRNGLVKMLYVAPERFNNERFRDAMQNIPVSLFAVDEAHCISEWGHNFRPDYLKLAGYARNFKAERILALTATATPQVLKDMCQVFAIEESCATCTGFYRENLTLLTTNVAASARDDLLVARLKRRPPGPTIVYVTLQKTAEEVASLLVAQGFSARPYHAGLKDEVRAATQDWFLASADATVVATIAFGMGVDKSNIRGVYHYNLPKSLENYSQEIGRAGRDGEPATCELLGCAEDLTVLENFALGDTPTKKAVQSLVSDVFSQEVSFDVSYSQMSNKHDIRILVVRTLLTYLELEGFLEGGTPFYSSFQFKALTPPSEIIEKFSGERQTFLQGLFAQADSKLTWWHIDVDAAAENLQQSRERIVVALDYLYEQGLLELKAQGVRNRYSIIHQPPNLAALSELLYSKMRDREKREIERLDQVIDFIELPSCQVNYLCKHFGQPLPRDCGHCSACLDKTERKLLDREASQLNEADLKIVKHTKHELEKKLQDEIQLTRFLCGVSSPAISKARLSKDARFGCLGKLPFRLVLQAVNSV